VASSSYLRNRAQLVNNYSSLPAIVQPVQCPAPSHWVRTLLGPLGFIIACVAIVAVTFATISCSNGVFLAAISGLVQAYGAWALLLHVEQKPVVQQVHYKPAWRSQWGPLGDVAGSLCQLLVTLISPALSLGEFILELVLYSWKIWTLWVLVQPNLKLVTRGRDARAKWLQPHGPGVTVLAEHCSVGDEAGSCVSATTHRGWACALAGAVAAQTAGTTSRCSCRSLMGSLAALGRGVS
jgi:type IV secretory pathway VirB2 component (pilin)